MKTKITIMVVALMLCAILGWGQTQPIATVKTDVQVFPSNNPQSEVSISIDKVSPQNLLISTNTFNTVGVGGNQGFYYSINGGQTWNGADQMQNISTNGVLGDPATCFDASGQGYITSINHSDNSYVLETSMDEGQNWSNPVSGISASLNEDFDKEMITTFDEMQTSPYANYFYSAWSDFNSTVNTSPDNTALQFNVSTDQGGTFSAPITLSSGVFSTGSNVQTGPNGEVYVCWVNRTQNNPVTQVSAKATSIGFAYSSDGGSTFPSANINNPAFTDNGGDIDLRLEASSPFAGTSVPFFPSMAVDKSCGSYRGRVYIAYMEKESSTDSRAVIRVRSSDDHGTSWSPNAIQISPDMVNGISVQENWFPWIAVDDATGLVNVVYYCLDQATGNSTNTYLAYSTDGGATWQNTKVSFQPHQHGPINNNMFRAGYCGDYIGLASFGGKTYASWHDNRTGNWNVYMAEIDYNIPVLISSPTDLIINEPATLPNNSYYQASTTISVATNSPISCATGTNVQMVAGESITIGPGFVANPGSVFIARISSVPPCSTPGAVKLLRDSGASSPFVFPQNANLNLNIKAYPNPTPDYITIVCTSASNDAATLSIEDVNGEKIFTTRAMPRDNSTYRFVYDGSGLASGIYFYTLTNGTFSQSGKFIKE